jgi:hypothetical protein
MQALFNHSNVELESLTCTYDASTYFRYCIFQATPEQIKQVADKFQLDHYSIQVSINEDFYTGVVRKGIELEAKGKTRPREEIARDSTLESLRHTPCQEIFSSRKLAPIDIYASDIYSISESRVKTKQKLERFNISQFQLLYSKLLEEGCVTIKKLSMSP